MPGFIAATGAAQKNKKITQNQIKKPASTESVKKPVRLCFIDVAFFKDTAARVSTAPVYNINYSPLKCCCEDHFPINTPLYLHFIFPLNSILLNIQPP